MPMQKPLAKSKGKLVSLVKVDDELRVDSRVLAEHLGNKHESVMALVDKYTPHFLRYGLLPTSDQDGFPISNPKTSEGGRPERYCLLSEDQSYFLLTLSRNSERVVDLKANLVTAFSKARKPQGPEEEYLPTYRALHDSVDTLAAESKNKKFVHMNFNKLINSTIGVDAGNRHNLPIPRKALMVVAQAAATHAISTAKDHHDGYQMAKSAMQSLKPVAQQLSGQSTLPIA